MHLKNSDTLKHLPSFVTKMENEGIHPLVIDTFSCYFKKAASGETGLIYDKDISPVGLDEIENIKNLDKYAKTGKRVLKKSVMIILNGGLGTSMGLTKAKSLLPVKDGKTFLEIKLRQAEHFNISTAFMNSYNTHKDTVDAISSINPSISTLFFLQHKFPKVLQEGLSPANWPADRDMEWNPPGHGDIYTALYTSGILKQLLDDGIIYAFISNSDNLGATIEESILGFFAENKFSFMMEVAERTPHDLKGGHLAKLKDSRLILRESAQCPVKELNAFRDIGIYRFFNTNNIWINLKFLNDFIEKKEIIQLPIIMNPKTLDPRDEKSPKVYQIETAMGSAISAFENATAIRVARSRLIPVKKCNDLLSVRSDCFILTKENRLIVNPARKLDKLPEIKLDPLYYSKIEMFDKRFENAIPSLIDCKSLTIKGDVLFQKNVTIKDEAVIKNSRPSQAVIKEGMVIDGEVTL